MVRLKDLLHKLSYGAYRSPDKVAEITRDVEMKKVHPILFYEKIAKLLHLRPYVLGIILIIWMPIGWSLQRWENPEVLRTTISILTLEKMVLFFVLWSFTSLIFFYLLPFIKETYFQTLQTLKPLISRSKYGELKENLRRDKITYSSLSVMFISLMLELTYEFYLGYKLGFWSENLPIWCGLRYGPISFSFNSVGLIPWMFFYSDIINEAFSWFSLPFAIKTSIKETARKDPEIFGDVKAFDKFNRSILRVTLLLLAMAALTASFFFILPQAPLFRMWYVVILFAFVPYLFASRLKGSAIKKSIAELQKELKRKEEKGDILGFAQTAEKIADFQKEDGQVKNSCKSILQAAKNFEKAGEYGDAAPNYSLAGKHREAAEAYKKHSKKEENENFAKYYEACSYSELAEQLMTERKMEDAYKNLKQASKIFRDVERKAEDEYLRHSSLYRKWETEGRLHVVNVLRECGPLCIIGRRRRDKNKEDIVNEFDAAIKAFERPESECTDLGVEAKLQLYLHITWCEVYKRLTHIERFGEGTQGRNKIIFEGIHLQPTPPFVRLTFKKVTPEERDKKSLLNACLRDLANMKSDLENSNRVKAKTQVNLALDTLHALRAFNFMNDKITASDFVKKAMEKAKELGIETDGEPVLNRQIDGLLELIFHINFQFSAPKCPVVNVNAYKNYVQFVFDGLEEIGTKKHLLFKIYYDPPRGEAAFEEEITLKLAVECDGEKEERKPQIGVRKEEIEKFPIEFPCELVKAKLSYVSPTCTRPLHIRNIFCDELIT